MNGELNDLNPDQRYFVDEFYEDYRQGLLTRRAFIKKLAYITGSMTATITVMTLLGCAPEELPAATDAMPTLEPGPPGQGAAGAAEAAATPAGLVPVPGARSPLSVPEGEPGLTTGLVAFDSQGEAIGAYLARPAAAGRYRAVLVCHENRGLNEHIKDVTRRFAREGYVALAVDLLSREGGTANLDPDQVPGLLGGAGPARHTADFLAAFAYLLTLDVVDSPRIAMTGYCFGGGVTWQVATAEPRLRAAAPFYGRGPELDRVPAIRAAVLGVYAELDQRINAGNEALEQALRAANVTYQFNVYPGVDHAFHNDTGGRYDETQATRAWRDTLAWFETYL